jgi:hypothetical protein
MALPLFKAAPRTYQFRLQPQKGADLIRSSKGDTDEILRRRNLYVKANGKTIEGLVNRRKAGAEMFVG